MDETPQSPADPFRVPPTLPTVPTVTTPPSPAAAPFAPPSVGTSSMATSVPEVRIEPEDPKRRRKGVLLGAGVGILAIVAVIVGVLLVGSGDDAEAYSLQAAATSAQAADTVAFTMHLEAAGMSIDMDARVDAAAKMMAMSAEMPTIADGTFSMIMDLGAERLYMDASTMPGGEAAPTKWISFDMSQIPGLDQDFGALTGTNPLDAAVLFDGASNVKALGMEDLNGEQVKHYVVTVSLDELKKAQPGVFDQLGDDAAELPSTVDYDVWVSKDSQLRKLAFAMSVLGQSVSMEMLVTAVGDIEPIVVPADDEVTDMTDLMAGGA